MSLPRALSIIAVRPRQTTTLDAEAVQRRLAQLLDLLLRIDWFVFTPTCWKRAAVLHRYLALKGIETKVVFGVRKDDEGKLEGHAWLEADGKPVLESNDPDYRVTYCYSA